MDMMTEKSLGYVKEYLFMNLMNEEKDTYGFNLGKYAGSEESCDGLTKEEYLDFCRKDTEMSRLKGAFVSKGRPMYYLENIKGIPVLTKAWHFDDVTPIQYCENKVILPTQFKKDLCLDKREYCTSDQIKYLAMYVDLCACKMGI